MENLLTIKEASVWATNFLGKSVTPSNIAYLINYGREINVAKSAILMLPNKTSLEGAYNDLLDIFERVGIELRLEIDEYFQKFNLK